MIDKSKKYVTRKHGYPVEVVATDLASDASVLTIYTKPDGSRHSMSVYPTGRYWCGNRDSDHDLVEFKEKRRTWIAFNKQGYSRQGITKDLAKQNLRDSYINGEPVAVVEVEYEEGQGL